MQPDGKTSGHVGRSRVQPFCDAERRQAVPVELPEIVPGLGGQERSDHNAREAAEETPRDRLQHDAFRTAQAPFSKRHPGRYAP